MKIGFRMTALAVLLVAGSTGRAIAQGTMGGGRAGGGRGAGVATGSVSFGASAIECAQCTVHLGGSTPWIEYGAEPRVIAVTSGAALLRPGDVIVAVDGLLITTAAGGRRLASLEGGRTTQFTIRRSGALNEIMVTPTAVRATGTFSATTFDSGQHFRISYDAAGNARVIPDRFGSGGVGFSRDSNGVVRRNSNGELGTNNNGRVYAFGRNSGLQVTARGGRFSSGTDTFDAQGSRLPRVIHADSIAARRAGIVAQRDDRNLGLQLPQALRARTFGNTSGWLGLGLECRNCSVTSDANGVRMWRFAAFPTVAAVDSAGPADEAGIEAGDVLRAVDGELLTSPTGASRFSTLRPGERARLTIDRNGRTIVLTVTLARID